MKSKSLLMIFTGVFLLVTLSFSDCTRAHKVYASSIASSKTLTTWLHPLPKFSPSWTRLTPAQVAHNGQITLGNSVIQLPVMMGQNVQYVIHQQNIYWSLTGSQATHLYVSSQQLKGKESPSTITDLLYASSSEGTSPAPSIQLFNERSSVYFTLTSNGKMDKDLYQVSDQQTVNKLFTLTWTPRQPLYALGINGNDFYAAVSRQFPFGLTLFDELQGALTKQVEMPYWPLNIVVYNQQIYLASGPDTYLLTTGNTIKPYSYIPQELVQLVPTVSRQLHSSYLVLPSLYFQNQIHQPFKLSTSIINSASYSMTLSSKSGGTSYQMNVSEVTKNENVTDYSNWIDTLNSLIANDGNKSVIANTNTASSQKLPAFYGKIKVTHQFILQSTLGPWLRWSQTASKDGNTEWYVTWGSHGWLYSIGPLPGPNDPLSQQTISHFIELSKQNPLQPVASTGDVNIKLNWNLGSAIPSESLYEYHPVSSLAVTLLVPGFAGWHDLANFSVIDTSGFTSTS